MTASTTATFGRTIGAAIGKSAAYVGHAACVSASYTGRFGADLVAGTSEGYATKAAELAERRMQGVDQSKLVAPVRRAKAAA